MSRSLAIVLGQALAAPDGHAPTGNTLLAARFADFAPTPWAQAA